MNPFMFLIRILAALALVVVFIIGISSGLIADMFRELEMWAHRVIMGDRQWKR